MNRIMQCFFNYPRKNFQIRELSRDSKIAHPSAREYVNRLLKDGLIIKEKISTYPSYKANRENKLFKFYKKIDTITRLHDTGLIDYINNSCFPKVIILFGSASIGEDIENSDIDIYVNSKAKKLNLEKYEKALKRKVNILFEEDFNKINKELRNNIINGTIMEGYLEAF